MALLTKRGRELPEGAIKLTEDEALEHQLKVINNWPKNTEVFSLKYGSFISSAVTILSSGIILNNYRNVFKIPKTYLLAVAPMTLLPGYVSYLATENFVTKQTVLMKFQCPVCNQLKFALTQCYTSLLFPIVYGLSSFVLIANFKKTTNFAVYLENPVVFWKDMYKVVKQGSRVYQSIGILQTVLVLFLPFIQAKQFEDVMAHITNEKDKEI